MYVFFVDMHSLQTLWLWDSDQYPFPSLRWITALIPFSGGFHVRLYGDGQRNRLLSRLPISLVTTVEAPVSSSQLEKMKLVKKGVGGSVGLSPVPSSFALS